MTLQDIKDRVREIADVSGIDDEAAHSLEDKLFNDVLSYIAASPKIKGADLAHMAGTALKAKRIVFGRWCA